MERGSEWGRGLLPERGGQWQERIGQWLERGHGQLGPLQKPHPDRNAPGFSRLNCTISIGRGLPWLSIPLPATCLGENDSALLLETTSVERSVLAASTSCTSVYISVCTSINHILREYFAVRT